MPTNTDPGLSSLIPAILKSIEHTMGTDLAAEMTTANGKVLVDMVRRLVRWSVAEIEQHQALYHARITSGAQLLGGGGQFVIPAQDGPAGLYASPTEIEKRYFVEVGVLAAVLKQEIHEAQGERSKRPRLAARLRQLIEGEVRFHAALDPESASDIASAYHGGKSGKHENATAEPPSVTAETLTRYLRRRFPQHPAVGAGNVQTLTGGMGKDTILFELTGHPQYSGPLVMRKDLRVLSLDVSAVDEFALLQAVHAAGVSVPEPLWAEHDSSQLGTRFIVVRRARGSVAIGQDISSEDIRRHFADKLAEGLVAIHNLRLPQLEMYQSASGKTLSGCLREQIDTWRGYWMRKRLEPSLKLETLFGWLDANVPPDPGIVPTLVHGDYGFHNLIMDQGEVTAILDWEFAHMGDPAEDVNYCRQFIERYVPFDYFLERYLARGGKPYDEARDRFFTVWRNVRNAVASIGALNAFYRETPGNIKMATAGLAYNPRFELEALRLVAGYLETDA
jgi:aminoglycoside phosphotransferase (APT) family kinase protein